MAFAARIAFRAIIGTARLASSALRDLLIIPKEEQNAQNVGREITNQTKDKLGAFPVLPVQQPPTKVQPPFQIVMFVTPDMSMTAPNVRLVPSEHITIKAQILATPARPELIIIQRLKQHALSATKV